MGEIEAVDTELARAVQRAEAAEESSRTRAQEAQRASQDAKFAMARMREMKAKLEAIEGQTAELDQVRAVLARAKADADGLRAQLREACAMRDAARLAVRRAASTFEEGRAALLAAETARADACLARAAEAEQQAIEWHARYEAERARLRQLAQRVGLLGLWRTVPLSMRQAVRNRLLPPA